MSLGLDCPGTRANMVDMKTRRPTIIGKATLDANDEPARCAHCNRAIRHLVHLSTGAVVGRSCALGALGYSTGSVSSAPRVHPDLATMKANTYGFEAFAWYDGQIRRFVRGCTAEYGVFTPWEMVAA